MEKMLKSQFFYSFIALLFALLLFFNANSDSTTRVTQSAQKFDTTVYDVPVQLDYDEKSYYVSGYPQTVTVHLSSLNRVKLAQEAGKETRSFKVMADLTNQKEGTVDVMLRATNLINGVDAVIDPAVISVTIEKKETKKFKVQPVLDDSFLKEGYQVNEINLSDDFVEVTTGKETMAQIASVQGKLTTDREVVDDFKEEVLLQALDEKGNVLPVTIQPERVTASVSIKAPSKTVPLELQQGGTTPIGVTGYQFQTKVKEVTASGPQFLLDKLTTLQVPVDVSGVKTKKEVVVPVFNGEKQLSFNPQNVTVTIVPLLQTSSTQENEKETSKETTDSSLKKVKKQKIVVHQKR